MNTSDLVVQLARRLNISQRRARQLLLRYITLLTENLANGRRIVLQGFGSFEIRDIAPREVYLPSSGEKVLIPGRRQVSFHPAKGLKEDVKTWSPPDE